MVGKYVSFLWALFKLELLSALEYRVNFFTQSFFMFLNDWIWIIFWYLLFNRFQTIKGYNYEHLMLLWAFSSISFAIVLLFFANASRLSRMIEEGKLDYYLSLPKNELIHSIAHMDYSAFGDLVFGIILAVWTVRQEQVFLFLLLIMSAVLVFLGWWIFVESLTFFFGKFEHAARSARDVFLTITLYPFSVYEGFTRVFLLLIVPAGLVAGVPVELMRSFSWEWLFFTVGFSVVFFSFSVWFFYRGLRRYESGNLLVMRG